MLVTGRISGDRPSSLSLAWAETAPKFPERAVEVFLTRVRVTHRLLSSSFLGLPYRILNMNHKKELLRSLWLKV